MGQVVPDARELEVINNILNTALTLRLYGNNKIPAHGDSTSGYTEIAGGGYVAKPLTFANWVITSGEPTEAVYPFQAWTFTDILTAPGTIYGYYVTRNSDNALMWAERFPSGVIPFAPQNGSIVRIVPRYSVQSQF